MLAVENRGSYTRKLSAAQEEQIIYWIERGIFPYCLLCWASTEEGLRKTLGTHGARYALIGDVTPFRWICDFMADQQKGKIYSTLPAEQRQIIAQTQISVIWVRSIPGENFPFSPVVL